MSEGNIEPVEVRGFLQLYAYLKKNFGANPLLLDIDSQISGYNLAEQLSISPDEIEIIFVNGFVQTLDFLIRPGDRVAFLPPGCPGPYRIALGFYGKNQGNKANFRIRKKRKSHAGQS